MVKAARSGNEAKFSLFANCSIPYLLSEMFFFEDGGGEDVPFFRPLECFWPRQMILPRYTEGCDDISSPRLEAFSMRPSLG